MAKKEKLVRASSKNFPATNKRQPEKTKGVFKKLLVLAAVILFIVIFGKGSGKTSGQGQGGNSSSTGKIVAENSAESRSSELGALGGPFAGLEQILINSAQGAVDLSVDDDQENADLMIMENNSLVAANIPDPSEVFGNYKKEVITYTVQQGDNPEKIGVAFGISADTVLAANNLKDGDIIKPGDKLIILPINGVRVEVSAKDNLNSLAKKYQGKADEIIAFNDLPSDGSLKSGDYIIIPGGENPVAVTPKAKSSAPKINAPKYASSTQQAGWLILPTTGTDWGRIHGNNGVDVANNCGTPIYAAAAGTVILSDGSGWNGGYGKYIQIKHPNGVVTLYGHASQLLVSQGEQVAQGQLIMLMGTTGRSTGCHLHFEVHGAKNPLAGAQHAVR